MINYRVVFALIFVALIIYAGLITIVNSANSSRIIEAEQLSETLKVNFKLTGEKCRAKVGDFYGQMLCLEKIIQEYQVVADMEEDEFDDFNKKTNKSGFVVLKNEGRNSLESSKFVLIKNHKKVDEGCIIQGNIDPDYTCRLEFNSECEDGDVLEIKYEGKRVYIKNC